MRVIIWILFALGLCIIIPSFKKESLRDIYSRPPDTWPKPLVDSSVKWQELGLIPEHAKPPKELAELGKKLFFDTRLSGSGKISCGTCHKPELSWADGLERSVGHDSAVNKRNAPSIQFAWFYEKLFWDGRARNLEDQVFAPINSESEMHSEMPGLMMKLNAVEEYKPLFKKAFGDEHINPDRMASAIAAFERSIERNPSRFDKFLLGDKKALTNLELEGLHFFRTKAGCMNCHNGPMFSDNQFHNTGFFNGEDDGLYKVTHKEDDKGKFKTPTLRNVVFTGPWMHDGSFKNLDIILGLYSKGPPSPESQLFHPFPADTHKALIAFLNSISAAPLATGH